MAPTADEIRAIFNDVYKIGADPHHVLGKYVSEHAEVSIVGDDHKGITSVHDVGNIFAPITEQIDTNQPKHTELVRVIGGGADNEWAALEFNSSGWSINGTRYHHEYVIVVRFDEEGKVHEGKGYFDTAHLRDFVAKSS